MLNQSTKSSGLLRGGRALLFISQLPTPPRSRRLGRSVQWLALLFWVGLSPTLFAQTWTAQTSNTTVRLNGVWSLNANNTWAVGNSGNILKYNGTSWSGLTSGTQHLNEVWGLNATNIWAVGENATIRKYDGANWSGQTVPNGFTDHLRGVWGLSATNIWAVGSNGSILKYNGTSWSFTSYADFPFDNTLYGIWGSDANNIWVVGSGGAIFKYNGTSWSQHTSGTNQNLLRVWGIDANNVWAVGLNGTILKYNGSSWSTQTSNTTQHLTGVWGSDVNNMWAVGLNGTILKYNGSSWSAQTSNITQQLNGVGGLNANTIWAVGNSGTILYGTTPPTITTGTATGTASACVGTTSSNQSFTVSGQNLTAGIVATAPADFELSTNAITSFASSLTLAQTGGSVASTTIYVRTTSAATQGSKSGNVTLTSTGATNQTVAVAATLNALPTVSIEATPSLTVASGSSVTLTASGANTGETLSYTWSTGESTTAIILSSVTSATAFSVTGVTGGCSATATVTVMQRPLALTSSAGQACVGTSIALSVSVTGGVQPYSYTWVAPAGTSISGSPNLSAVSASASVSGAYTFTVTVADANTTFRTSTVSVTANTPPGIMAQPAASSVVCAGSAVSVPVSATGSNLSYQWYKGSTPVASQTAAALSLPASTTDDAGSYLVVVANGGCQSVTSTAFSLTVNAPAGITAQPVASSVVCVGSAVSVPVSVSGSVLGQQWYKDGSPVASQTATTLSLPSPTTADAGSYKLVIQTSSCGSLTSSAFSLSVNAAPVITAQPAASSVVCAGSAVSVPVSATGSNLSYQWYKGSTPVASQTAATLSLPTASTTDSGSYSVVVANSGCQSVTSTAFSLTVNAPAGITVQPSASSVVCVGSAVSVPVSVSGSVLGRQWYKDGSPVASQTATTLSLPSPTTADAGSYKLVIQTSSCGSLTSSAFSLSVNAAPGITAQPAARSVVCVGNAVSVPVSATGSNLSYQWYKDGSPVASQTTATLSLPASTTDDAGSYSVVVANSGCQSVTSTAFSLTVNAPAGITVQPSASSVVCVGSAVSVPVSVSGSVLGRQWYKDGSPVASQTATTLSLPSPTTADAGSYKLEIQTSSCGSLTSSAFSLSVNAAPGITAQPAARSVVCVGNAVSVPVSATGSNLSYQWYKDGSPVASQTTATLSLPASTTDDAGSYSVVVANSGCQSVTSTAFSLTVNTAPTISISPLSITLIGGESTTLTASGASSYSWSTGSSQTAIVVSPIDDTVYSVTGSSNGCSARATATVSVTCGKQVMADAISTTVTQTLSPANCAVSLRGTGYGTGFAFTGPGGYVYSAVYRRVGNYTINAPNVTQPGTYTMKVSYTDACRRTSSATMTYVVTGEACK